MINPTTATAASHKSTLHEISNFPLTQSLAFYHAGLQLLLASLWPLGFLNVYLVALVFISAAILNFLSNWSLFPRFGLFFIPVVGLSAVLSYFSLFPRGWTELHENSAIPNQALGYLMLPLLIGANAYTTKVMALSPRRIKQLLLLTIILCGFINPIISVFFRNAEMDGLYQDRVDLLTSLGFGTLTNNEAILMFVVLLVIHQVRSVFLRFIFSAVLAAISFSAQSLLIAVFSFLQTIASNSMLKFLRFFAIASVFFAIPAVIIYWQPLWFLDSNTGIRGKFWADAFRQFWSTGAFGSGFGTELIEGSYRLDGGQIVVIQYKYQPGQILIGVHNEFIQLLVRTGIAGTIILLLGYAKAFPGLRSNRLDYTIFFCLTLTLTLNVAIASFNLLFGTAVLWGWLHYRKRASEDLAKLAS